MTNSSVSTYLDVAHGASGIRGGALELPDTDLMQRSAKVLATIHAGTELATELPEKTGLSMDEILTTLGWLSKTGLVELDESDGNVAAHLTESVKTILNRVP